MYSLQHRTYLIYNIFCEAHFIQVDDLPPIIPQLQELRGEELNIAIKLPYKAVYNLRDVDLSETALEQATKGEEWYAMGDAQGVKRKIKFLKLKNILAPAQSPSHWR